MSVFCLYCSHQDTVAPVCLQSFQCLNCLVGLLLQVQAGPLPDYNAPLHNDSAKQAEPPQTEAQAKVSESNPETTTPPCDVSDIFSHCALKSSALLSLPVRTRSEGLYDVNCWLNADRDLSVFKGKRLPHTARLPGPSWTCCLHGGPVPLLQEESTHPGGPPQDGGDGPPEVPPVHHQLVFL